MTLPPYRWRFAHLAALWAYGVSQPVFSMLKGNPEFLVVRGSTRGDVVLFALLLAFVPPLLVVAVEALVSFVWTTLARALHIVAIWGFGYLAALQFTRLLEIQRGAALLVPLIPACAAAVIYMKSRGFQTFLSLSFLLPVAGLLAFVVTVPLAVNDAAAAEVQVRSETPVILVVFDEFPVSSIMRANGSIDAVRYPNFARLAREGTWYPRATSVHEYTTQAVPAVLTGLLPKKGELPTLADHPKNLFTLLGTRYTMDAIEPITRLCPARYCPDAHGASPPIADRLRGLSYDVGVGFLYRVLPVALRGGLPPIGDRWGGFGDDNTAAIHRQLVGARDIHDVDRAIEQADTRPTADFERFLASIKQDESRRTLHFVHTLLPHVPWRLLPSGDEYGNASTIDGMSDAIWSNWDPAPERVHQALQRHLLQVQFTDRLVGRMLRRLREDGLFDSALVIVTADHGASFQPGGSRRSVTKENVSEIAGVPMFVKYPRQRLGRTDYRDAKTIDVVPTVADVLGIRTTWQFDGRSLRAAPIARRVSVSRKAGGAIDADPDAVARGVLLAARRNALLFGEGTDSMYRLGLHSNLLGRPLTDFDVASTAVDRVRFDGEEQFANVSRASGFVPARVVGEIGRRTVSSGTQLAIAINGSVAATTIAYSLDGATHFAALVPERMLRNGENAVDVYSISGSGRKVVLARLGGTSSIPRYAIAANGRSITLPSGKRAPVTPNRIAGRVESSVVEGSTMRIRGWAADLRSGKLVDRVLVFSGRQLIFAGRTGDFRWDIPSVSSRRGLARVGFVAEVPAREAQGLALRAFAMRGSAVSELEWNHSQPLVAQASGIQTAAQGA